MRSTRQRRPTLPPRPPRARTLALAGAIVALSFTAVLMTWAWRHPSRVHASGWFQGDMPTYVCYGRMAASSPSTLSYASPHDLREPPPPLLVNLPISVIGWLLTLGVPPGWIGHALRLLFGTGMYLALGLLLRNLFRPGRWFWSAFVAVGLGSGFAWLAALIELEDVTRMAAQWRGAVRGLERPYYWWFLDVFRNLVYPLELAYHALIFAQLWALGSRRLGSSVLFCALACASNPFVGIQASGVQAATLTLACLREPRPPWRVLVASAFVIAAFGAYYGLVLPSDPVIASLQEQHQRHLIVRLDMKSALVAYGPILLSPLPLIADPRFRRWVWRRFHLVPVLLLGLWTAALSQNDRLSTDTTLMPMHFTRGYLHATGWIVALAWLQHVTSRGLRPRPSGAGAALAVILAASTVPDAAMFVQDMYDIAPHNPSLVWPRDWQRVHEWLREQPPGQRVLSNNWAFGRQVCALHEHRSAIGTNLTTPIWDERQRELRRYERDPTPEPPIVQWADLQIVKKRETAWLRAIRRSGRWEEAMENATWVVFRRRLTSEADRPPGGPSEEPNPP